MSKGKISQKMGISGASGFLDGFVSDSLISSEQTIAISEKKEEIAEIEIRKIYRPKQQRLFFDKDEIRKLKTAIREEGFRGVILVTPLPSDHEMRSQGYEYELVFGASRVLACEEMGLDVIRSEVRMLTPQQVRRIRFDENMVRKNLNPYEELSGYLELMADEASVTIDTVEQELNTMSNAAKRDSTVSSEISKNIEIYQNLLSRYNGGKLTTFRSKLIKFRSLPEEIKEVMLDGKIDASKALEIGSIKDATVRQELLDWIVDESPSVAAIRAKKKDLMISNTTKEETPSYNLKKANTVIKRLSSLTKGKDNILNKKNKEVTNLLDKIDDLLKQIEEIS